MYVHIAAIDLIFLFRRRPGTSLTAVTLWFCVCCIPEGLIAAAIARPRTVTLFMFNIIKYFIPLDKRQPAIADGDVNIANMDASIAITVSRTIEEPAYHIKEIALEIYYIFGIMLEKSNNRW